MYIYIYIYMYIYIYIHIYIYIYKRNRRPCAPGPRAWCPWSWAPAARRSPAAGAASSSPAPAATAAAASWRPRNPVRRDRRNTVEIVLFEISNSMTPYPSVCHAYTSKLRPVIGLFETKHLDGLFKSHLPVSESNMWGAPERLSGNATKSC